VFFQSINDSVEKVNNFRITFPFCHSREGWNDKMGRFSAESLIDFHFITETGFHENSNTPYKE